MGKIRKLLMTTYFGVKTKQYKHLKYMFIPEKHSKVLLIVFSGFPGFGNKPVYNYVKTLKSMRTNKLFLLDDFGCPDNYGSYYLGENGEWFLPDEICELVDRITADGIEYKITIGSSKGGTSALYYAIRCQAKYAIIGAPQYHIGNYLNTEEFAPIVRAICGDASEESINRLNCVMPDIIKTPGNSYRPRVFLHYSPKEHTYPEHIKDLIDSLRDSNYIVEEDCEYSYINHSDVAKIFPTVLVNKLNQIVIIDQ